jgi:hypothetical protein
VGGDVGEVGPSAVSESSGCLGMELETESRWGGREAVGRFVGRVRE